MPNILRQSMNKCIGYFKLEVDDQKLPAKRAPPLAAYAFDTFSRSSHDDANAELGKFAALRRRPYRRSARDQVQRHRRRCTAHCGPIWGWAHKHGRRGPA